MNSKLGVTAVLLACVWLACSNPNVPETQQKDAVQTTKKSENMKNLISIVEIPVTDFKRAVTFYQSILNVTIEEMDMDGVKLGAVPSDEGTVNMVLAKGNDYQPTASGAVLYLNAGEDLQPMLDKAVKGGGKLIVPKTEISPEMGFFALFIDTEGNKMGLHSSH